MQSISHELSTPLTPLAGYLKILQSEKLGALNERQKKIVESMLQSADRLAHTIDNLSDFAVLETGNYRVKAEAVDAVAVANKVIEEAQATTAKPKRVKLSASAGPSRRLVLQGRPSRLQVLQQACTTWWTTRSSTRPTAATCVVELLSADGPGAAGRLYDQGSGAGAPRREPRRVFEPTTPKRRTAPWPRWAWAWTGGARKIGRGARRPGCASRARPKVQPESERHFSGSKFVLEFPLGAASARRGASVGAAGPSSAPAPPVVGARRRAPA
jgi:hypothetical protein